MALMERVSALIRANLNDLVDKAEDPEKMLKQVILDMENQLMQVKTQVAVAIADEHLLTRKKQKENDGETRRHGCGRRSWRSTRRGRARPRRARAGRDVCARWATRSKSR